MIKHFRLKTAILLLTLGVLGMSAFSRAGLDTCYAKSLAAIKDISVKIGDGVSLNFDAPMQTQTGDITFIVNAPQNCINVRFEVLGTAFINDNESLATEYQLDGESTWHKAGDTFVIATKPGILGKIRFRATTGSEVTSQHAGRFKAKLRINIISATQKK